jgi:hypothetical protein
VQAARYHKAAGYLGRAVERGEIVLEDALRSRLGRIGAIEVAHSNALRRELATIEPVLARACEAPPVCIKGPAIGDRFYSDPRLRPFIDLDLLVPRDRLDRAAEALIERGYEALHEFRPGFGKRHGHDLHLVRRIGKRALHVELHWRIGDDPACAALDYGCMAPDGSRIQVDGVPVSVPALPKQVLCLAVHLLSDRAKRLIWVQDLALAGASASGPEWRLAFDFAGRLGLGWTLHRALDYASRHLNFEPERPLPPGRPPAWGPLRAVEELDMRASLHVGRLATLGPIGGLRYLREVLVPTKEGLSGTVGADGAPPWRLVGRHLRSVVLGLGPRRR